MSISTVWSLEVGKSSLKAVKLHRDQAALEIVAVDKIDYEAGESGIDAVSESKSALRTFASRNTIDCPVAVVHPSRSAFSRFIQLPPVDPKKLEEMVGYEAQQQIPFPIDEVIWDYHISEGENGAMEKEVGIFAVRREAISDFILDYEQLPLELISVGYIGLLNYVIYDLRPNRPVVVLDIGSDDTDLLIVDGKRFWFRSLAGAGKDFTQALQEKFKLDFPKAEEMKIEGAKSEHAAKIFQVLQPHLRDMVNEINRSIGFYKSQAGEVKFEDLFLFGNGSKLLGLKNFLQEHLKFRVHQAKGFHRLRVNREANVALLQRDFPAFASSVGVGIQALGEGEVEANLLPQEKQEALEFKKKQKKVLLAAASLLVIPAWLYFSYDGKIRSAQTAFDSAGIVGELQARAKEIAKVDEALAESQARETLHVLGGVKDRIEPREAWGVIQELFSRPPNAAVVELQKFDQTDEDSKASQLAAEQEALNEKKWWLTLVEIRRGWLDAAGKFAEKRERESTASPVYEVSVSGVRYRIGTQTQNFEAVREQMRQLVAEKLRERFGAAYSDEAVTVEILGEEPPRIFTDHAAIRQKSGPKDKEDAARSQGVLFEFKVRWLQPLREPETEKGTEE